jgi:hypothetical protein
VSWHYRRSVIDEALGPKESRELRDQPEALSKRLSAIKADAVGG